ncbi:MAG: type II toxin-antitoxin system RelE/ParE family toxin [Candidatus Pacearchaeota archaeon]|nr:type II toxin-antitoxin system RelE/ParE family toxin [Candidatus Pacearchaeota archaeon]
MIEVEYKPEFLKIIGKLDNFVKEKVKKQVAKIIDNPEIGKPMMHERKGTREIYIKPFRLSYAYLREENKIVLLDLYHKDKQ